MDIACLAQAPAFDQDGNLVFNIDVPKTCPGVPDAVLDPRGTWPDPAKYDEQAKKLAGMFVENFKAFEKDVPASVILKMPIFGVMSRIASNVPSSDMPSSTTTSSASAR